MKIKHIVIFFACLCLGYSAVMRAQTSANGDARAEWMRGYVKMESADKSYDEGNSIAALQAYREARNEFEQVRRRYPKWNQALIGFRINYCANRIAELEKKVSEETEDMSREELMNMVSRQAQTLQENAEELTSLKRNLASTTEALARTRREAAANSVAEANLDKIKKRNAELENSVQLLQIEIDRLKNENASLDKMLAEADNSDRRKKRLKEAEDQLKLLRRQMGENDGKHRQEQEQLAIALNENKRLLAGQQAAGQRITELERLLAVALETLEKTENSLRNAELRGGRVTGDSRTRGGRSLGEITRRLQSSESEDALREAAAYLQIKDDELAAASVDLQRSAFELKGREQEIHKLEDEFAGLQNRHEQQTKQLEDLQLQDTILREELEAQRQQNLQLHRNLKALAELSGRMEKKLSASDATVDEAELQLLLNEAGTLREQIRQQESQEQMLAGEKTILQNTTSTVADYRQQINELMERLQKEENQRRDLEIALVNQTNRQLDAENNAGTLPEFQGPIVSEASRSDHQENVIREFLRQAYEAEKNGKGEAAVWNYQKVLELDPDNRQALKRLGLMAANNGDDEETAKYLRRAFRFDTDDPDLLLALGFAMLNLEQPEWALADLWRALALKPDSPDISRVLGVALVRIGWRQAAEIQFKRAHELAPANPEVMFNLAILCLTDKPSRMAEAREWYRKALENGAEKDPRLEAVMK